MKKAPRLIGLILAFSLVFGAGYFAGSTSPVGVTQAQQPSETEATFAPFWEVWTILKQRFLYTERMDDTGLMEAALNGLVNSLGDENTAYMSPAVYSDLTNRLSGEYEGIGATVRKDEKTGGVYIVSTTPGSPARAQLRQGDIILSVNGNDITGVTITEAVSQIRGPEGTFVELSVLRREGGEIETLRVQRAKIKREIVTATVFEGNIGYIGISSFAESVPEDMARALREMNANSLNGLILDMRNDPGGGLQTAIDVASFFLEDGTVIIQRGRTKEQTVNWAVSREAIAPDVPLVVILNQASASASELVAGALQDRGRAKVVGTYSFGKGSIQQWLQLSNGGGIRVTIAEFFKPSGGVINHIGILPNVFVGWTEDQAVDMPWYDPQISEAIMLLRGEF
ncbi:MAG TPA: S41 family peptidase [Aggregatilineales bacterium]|nr:S41 family peptidase [Anaerolineales bacterium]HRE46665.1 S41 family peptidase [Aggregatilineales bacterium]